MSRTKTASPLGPLPALIFSSRWLQLPLYLGLIVAQGVYVFLFVKELWHLILEAPNLTEQTIMLIVLGLIDVVMISNLLVMVIVGGYETFVSRLNLAGAPGPARVAEPRQRERAQGQARNGDHRHQLDPPAQDLHRGRRHRRTALVQHDGRHGGGTGIERRRARPARRARPSRPPESCGKRLSTAFSFCPHSASPGRTGSCRRVRAPREPLKPLVALRLLPICDTGAGCDAALQQFLPLIRPSS